VLLLLLKKGKKQRQASGVELKVHRARTSSPHARVEVWYPCFIEMDLWYLCHARTLFAWLISHQPTLLFSQNKPAPAISQTNMLSALVSL
jgi:hypothetical protein